MAQAGVQPAPAGGQASPSSATRRGHPAVRPGSWRRTPTSNLDTATLPGQPVRRHDLAPGAALFVLPAARFKTFHLLAAFQLLMDPSTVTRGALLPRVLRRGTRRWPDMASLTGHLEDLYGASFGTAASKMGDRQVVEATFSAAGPTGPGGTADLPVQGARLLTEVFADPAPDTAPGLRPDYVREEKDGLARDIAAVSDDRMSYAHYRCIAEMCRGEPNALHSLGQAADIGAIDPVGLDRFRRELLAEAPFTAYLAGPVDEAMTRDVVRVFTDFIAARSAGGRRRTVPPSAPHGRPEREKEVFEPADVEQGRLVVGLQTGTVLGQDHFPAQVLYNGLLGGFVHSRLFRRIREEAGLAYYAWSRVIPTKGIILISCGIQERHYGKAVDLIRQEVASLGRGDFTEAEFEATRNSVLAAAKAQLDSPGVLVYGHLERLSTGESPEEIAPWRRLQAVSADDVRKFASRPVLDTIYLLGRERGGH